MRVNTRFIHAGAVFMIAFSTGYVMQNVDAIASRFGASEPPAPERLDVRVDPVPELAVPAAVKPAEPEPLVPLEREVATLGAPATQAYAERLLDLRPEPEPQCETILSTTASGSAMLTLEIASPCDADKKVEIRHEALRFAEILDESGSLTVDVPALAETAHIEVQMGEGTVWKTSTTVPDFDDFERVALQWQGQAGVELHAFEYGAARGHPGHIHAGNPRTPQRAELLGVGFLSKLGSVSDGPKAEIYSFPSEVAQNTGTVRRWMMVAVTEANCGREIEAQVLRPMPGTGLEPMELSLTVPGCDSVGEFLVLNNLLQDMRIAAN